MLSHSRSYTCIYYAHAHKFKCRHTETVPVSFGNFCSIKERTAVSAAAAPMADVIRNTKQNIMNIVGSKITSPNLKKDKILSALCQGKRK